MTTKTRYFMLGSAGVVVAGLCTGLIAYYGGLPTGAFQGVGDIAELEYVPSDSAVVAYANVRDVMDSEVRRRLQGREPDGGRDRKQFETETGINIETDIDRVVAGLLPGDGEGQGFAIVRGRFNDVQIESFARQHGATVDSYQGKRLLTRRDGNRDGVLAFLGTGLIALGDDVAVRRAIDTERQGGDITANPDMMGLIRETQTGHNAWAVGRFDVLASRARLPEQVASQVPAIERFAAGGYVNGGLSGLFRADTRDDQAAANLRDVLRGFVALARMQTEARPELRSLLQSLELGGTGRTVALTFSIPADIIDAVLPSRAQ